MFIRNLIVKKKPITLEIVGNDVCKILIAGVIKFWPKNTSGVALFLFEFANDVSDDDLKIHGIARSAIGPYVYLNSPKDGDFFYQELSIPKGELKRIHLQLWNSKSEVLFEEIRFSTSGGTLHSEYEFQEDLIVNDLKSHFKSLPDNSEILTFNLLNNQEGCSPRCHAICSHWYKTMDDYAKSHANIDAKRTNFNFFVDGKFKTPLTAYHSKPAMLSIPKSIETYMYEIGDKSRNMIRKAIKLGYSYKVVLPNNYIDDIVKIRTSDTLRQGQAIPEYFYQRPDNVLSFDSDCKLHGELFFGLFKDDELIAYSTIFLYGELAQVNHILGHKDHLQNGVMNLLVYEIVSDFINTKPWIKGVNYLYPGLSDVKKGTSLFKKSVGFKEEAIVTTQAATDITSCFKNPKDIVKPSDTKIAPTKIKEKKATPELELIDSADEFFSAEDARKFILKEIGLSEDIIVDSIIYDAEAENFIGKVERAIVFNTVIVENLTLENYIHFLSYGIKDLSENISKNTFVVFSFVSSIKENGIVSSFINGLLKEKNDSLNKAVIEYITRRFRVLDVASVRNGFKSGDYALKGLVSYKKDEKFFGFDSFIVLKKVH